MAANQNLPEWVAVLQALLVPVIAAVGAWIALQQMHLATVRIRHDLFDRRFAILQSTQGIIDVIASHRKIPPDVFAEFATSVGAARFVLDERLSKYLREVLRHVSAFQNIQTLLPDMPPGDDKSKAICVSGSELGWLIDQSDGLGEKFQPFLQLEQRWSICDRRGSSR